MEEKKIAEERAKRDWKNRFEHRLQADEYESDKDHKADPFCGKCNLPKDRKGFIGVRYKDDYDSLRVSEYVPAKVNADMSEPVYLDVQMGGHIRTQCHFCSTSMGIQH